MSGLYSSTWSSYEKKPFDSSLGSSLKTINWSEQSLPPVRKNFYKEHPTVTNRSESEVMQIREELGITVSGNTPKPVLSFSEANFPQSILQVLNDAKFSKPTPIQCQGWPLALSGKDFVGIAQTGSGKTLAFILPALVHIADQEPLRVTSKQKGDGPIVLVLSPTRELAMQTTNECNRFGRSSGIFNSCIYGGVPRNYQQNELEKGVHVVVATPGRLIDFLQCGSTNLKRVTYLVLDEADRMLDMGFEPQIRKVISQVRPDRQLIMCSATWPKEVQALANDFLVNPAHIQVGSFNLAANSDIRQYIEVIDDSQKQNLLYRVMKEFVPKGYKIVIFTETKRGCDSLARDLKNENFPAGAIHGDKSQRVTSMQERDQILKDFRESRSRIMVATDVASRGLGSVYADVKDVGLVVNFDFPATIEDYVHRVGRTGRAGASGVAISFFTRNNMRLANGLIDVLKESKQKIPDALFKLKDLCRDGKSVSRFGERGRSRSPRRFY